MEDLYQILKRYSQEDWYPFHMPGHKRQTQLFRDLYEIDLTEITGFDNLHHAEGILLEAQQRAARLYGSEETHYLINGSTAGLLAAISACAARRSSTVGTSTEVQGKAVTSTTGAGMEQKNTGEIRDDYVRAGRSGRILMARNCHKAAYHGVFLNGLHATWLYPQTDMRRGIYGSIDPEDVRRELDADPQIRTVLLTCPTYDGVRSDIRAIAEIVHAHDAVLIVDGAHGAHFGMHPDLPEHPIHQGADIVINSLHKTLPAPTGTAVIHVNGPRVDRERLRKYLGIYQTSSPSYVFMAAMDRCVCLLLEQGEVLFTAYLEQIRQIREKLAQMKVLHLVDGTEPELYCYAYDATRLIVSTEQAEITGLELFETVREKYHIEAEMAAEHYVTFLTSVCDTPEGFERLTTARIEIDRNLCQSSQHHIRKDDIPDTAGSWQRNEEVLSLEEADACETRSVPLEESIGCVSGEYVYLYPPGIPLLIPGERIQESLIHRLEEYRKQGFSLQGMDDYSGNKIKILCPNR